MNHEDHEEHDDGVAGEPKGRELVPDAWRELDDTLADGPAPAATPPEARAWLADQRFLHGLLRAMHSQDAAARESRVAGILERIDAAGETKRRWLPMLLAALVLACVGLWLASPPSLPTAEAAVQRAVDQLARDVARRFRVVAHASDSADKEVMRHEFALVTSPGSRFRVSGTLGFGPLQLGEFQLGCDGTEIWGLSANGMFRRSGPLAERERLLQAFGDSIDLGYLDVHDLVQRLPGDFELATVGREVNSSGHSVLRVQATRKRADGRVRLRDAWLLCDEATGMITRLEATADLPRGASRRLSIEYLGEEPPGLVQFGRPW